MNDSSPSTPPRRKSRGSEKRQAIRQRNFRVTPEDDAALQERLKALGCSLSAMVKRDSLGKPLPRARTPKVEHELMRRFFVEIARTRDAIKPIEAMLGWAGSNLNQAVHAVNAAALVERPIESLANILADAAQQTTKATEAVESFIRDLDELRTAGMNGLGLELRHGGDDGDA